jgi:hypothetical protein
MLYNSFLSVYVNYVTLIWVSIHPLLVYPECVNILGGSVRITKENAEALVMASKKIGPEVNADKTKYMVMPRDQHVG